VPGILVPRLFLGGVIVRPRTAGPSTARPDGSATLPRHGGAGGMTKETAMVPWRVVARPATYPRPVLYPGIIFSSGLPLRWSCRFADDQFRRYCYLRKLFAVGRAELLQQGLDSQCSHLVEWLANGGEARGLEGRLFNVVEANDGDILRYSQAYIMERADAADRSDVVEREKCSEAAVLC
jgi:hypothetical protein